MQTPGHPWLCPQPTSSRKGLRLLFSVCHEPAQWAFRTSGDSPHPHCSQNPPTHTHTHAHARTPSAAAPEATGRRSVSGLLAFSLTATAHCLPLQVSSRDANYSPLWAQQLTGREGAQACRLTPDSVARKPELEKKKKKRRAESASPSMQLPARLTGSCPEPSGKRSPKNGEFAELKAHGLFFPACNSATAPLELCLRAFWEV